MGNGAPITQVSETSWFEEQGNVLGHLRFNKCSETRAPVENAACRKYPRYVFLFPPRLRSFSVLPFDQWLNDSQAECTRFELPMRLKDVG